MINLTDKWRKGELPDGFYWCDVDIYEDGNITKQIESFIHHHPVFYWETSIVRVIELAPSFSEYKSMQEENTKLKELLKLNNVLDKGLKSILVWLKEETQGEQKELCEQLYEDTLEMMSKIDQVLADNQIQANTVACNKIQENK